MVHGFGVFLVAFGGPIYMWVALNWNHSCVSVLQLDFWGRSDVDYLVEIWGLFYFGF